MLDIPPEIAVGGVGFAFALVIFAFLSQAEEKSVVRESLRQLDGPGDAEPEFTDERLEDSLLTRAMGPLGEVFSKLGRKYTPHGYIEQVRTKHMSAGIFDADAVDRFLATKVVLIIGVLPMFYITLILNPLGLEGLPKYGLFVVLAAVMLMGPDSSLNRKVEARQTEILSGLPDVLDLLTISVEAGLGFEQALDRCIENVPGALSDEFARMLGETRAGAARADALRNMDERIAVAEVRSFILAIIQADTFGVSIGRVLRAQAEEMRIKRRQLAQEKAQKAPVKMLIPMVFCIFPSIFVVILGPAVINISKAF